ncbi:EB1C [Symbiodinium sp. CCMP2456]|nr:EB1C [Symbiodinium sp. CCMP2456]
MRPVYGLTPFTYQGPRSKKLESRSTIMRRKDLLGLEEAKHGEIMYCPSGKEEWSTDELGLSEQSPAPPPPGNLVQSAGFVVGLDEFDGGVSRSSVGVLDQSMLEMRLAGDFYNVPENVPRGVQLEDPGMFHTPFPGEEASFRLDRMPFDFDHKSGSVVQKVQDFPELSFPAHVMPAQEPPGGCLNTCVELRNVHAREAFTCAFNFFKTKASASFSNGKVREQKLAMKATVFHTSCSGVLVSCLLKARIFSAAEDPSKLLFECTGQAYQGAVMLQCLELHDSFGGYLKHFMAHYGHFFREKQETHLFVYSKLHQEFKDNLEKAVSEWLAAKGLTEWHLEAILEYAKETSDVETSGIVAAMLRLLEYHTWIEYIFGLKESPEIQELLSEQWSQPGWERIGDSEVDWTVRRWEAWTDEEWHAWWASRQQWSDEEWEAVLNFWKTFDSFPFLAVFAAGHSVLAMEYPQFRRCSGDALAFAHAFEEASKHLRSNLMADADVSRDSDAIHDRIPGTGEEHNQIQPLVDMVAAGSPSTLEAEAVAALAALALSADPAGTTALLAALRDVQKTLVELCVNSSTSIDTAYPAARLVSKLVCKSDVDAEAQQIACDLTRAVCGATHLDSLVRGELAEAVRAVARKRTMQLPMQSGLDERQLAQALQTLEEPGPFMKLQDGVMA